MRQNKHNTETYVVHHNTLPDSFQIQIAWYQTNKMRIRYGYQFLKTG